MRTICTRACKSCNPGGYMLGGCLRLRRAQKSPGGAPGNPHYRGQARRDFGDGKSTAKRPCRYEASTAIQLYMFGREASSSLGGSVLGVIGTTSASYPWSPLATLGAFLGFRLRRLVGSGLSTLGGLAGTRVGIDLGGSGSSSAMRSEPSFSSTSLISGSPRQRQ